MNRGLIIGGIVALSIIMIGLIIMVSSTPSAPVKAAAPTQSFVLPPSSTPVSTMPSDTPVSTPIVSAPVSTSPVEVIPSGCTKCLTGVYACPADKIVAPGQWYNNQASQISTYRLPAYDPATPNITIDGAGYYFRQVGGC
jgi:ferredoxin